MRDLGERIEELHADAEALEAEAHERHEQAAKLEKELNEAERRRRDWPAEPEEIRCFCGQPLVAHRPPPVGGKERVGQRPPVFELPGPEGCPVDVCPACRADLEVVLAELVTVPTASAEVRPGQLALSAGAFELEG